MRERRFLHDIGLVSALAISVGAFALFGQPTPAAPPPPPSTPMSSPAPLAVARHWFHGTPLPSDAPQPLAVAIAIDNAPEARPQSGIADAPLVFEVPVEGGRTRFLAVFPMDATVREVGPVRSARPYLIGLSQAIGAPLVHVGGSPAALRWFRAKRAPHIDQYFDPPFRRTTFRSAPFNVYVAMPELAEFLRAKGWEEELRNAIVPLWTFAESSPEGGAMRAPEGARLRLAFGSDADVVAWEYDDARGVYTRSQGGRVHRDADGHPVTATNIVVLHVSSRVLDGVGRLAIPALDAPTTATFAALGIPHGDRAQVWSGGRVTRGQWSWAAEGARERFVLRTATSDRGDAAHPIALQPGTTWVAFINVAYEW